MLSSIILISKNSKSSNSNSFSSLLESDLSDFEKLCDHDLNIDKTDEKSLNKYVVYSLN